MIYKIFLLYKITSVTGGKRTRCGDCTGCVEQDCGVCKFCMDMKKFGGKGRKKQCCVKR